MSSYTDEDEFGAPASVNGIKWEEHKGRLFAIKGIAQEFDMETQFGKADPVRARAVIVDGPDAGTVFEDTLVFPKVLAGALRPFGRVIVGRLGQGQAKRGQSAPWVLEDATDAELAQAKDAWRASLAPAGPSFGKPARSADSPY